METNVGSTNLTTDPQAPEPTDLEEQYPMGWRLVIIIVSLCLGTLLIAIDNTILAVAIPRITTVFNSLNDVGWYGSAYILSITALQPIFGNIYKNFNVKTTYLMSITIFEAGSIICAAARDSPMFILGRAIAGVGAAGLFQGALNIVSYTVPLAKRPMYLGIVVSVFGLANCFGPVLGGAFTSDVSWRWCFWINVPVGVPVFFPVLFFLKLKGLDQRDRSLSTKVKLLHMDILGAMVFISAICCLLLALQWGGITQPWKSSTIIGLFIGCGLLISVFIFIEWRLEEKATVPLRFLNQRSLLMGACFGTLIYASNYLDGYFLPFYFQAAQSVSASNSGVRFIALAVPEVVAVVIMGAVVTKLGFYVPFMVLSTIVGSIGTGLLSTIGLDTSTIRWAAYMVITGIGIGIGVQLPYTAVQVVASERDMPIANAIIAFFAQLGGAIAIPIGETILVNTVSSEIRKHTPGIPLELVVYAGATNLKSSTTDSSTLRSLQASYSQAVTNVLYFATAVLAMALPFAVFMEWKTVKKVASEDIEGQARAGYERSTEGVNSRDSIK